MELEKDRITPFQYMFSIACYLQSSALLTSFLVPIVRQDSWLVVLAGMVAAVPVLLLFLGIMRSFPGKNLIEIFQMVFGRIVGSVLSVVLILFMMTLTTLNLSDLGVFLRQTLLVETPMIVTILLCMVVCAYTVRQGFKVLTRFAPVFALLSYILTVLAVLFTLNLMKSDHFLPMMAQQPIKYVQSVNIITTIPFSELVVFLMVTPYVSRGKKSRGAYLFGGFFLGSSTILAVVAQDTAILGNTIGLFSLPPYVTLRLVNFGSSLNRVEILFSIVLIILLFFKISFLLYATVLACAQLFGLKSYRPMILIISALIIAYAQFIYPSAMQHIASARENESILFLFFEILLPLAALIGGRIRRMHNRPIPDNAPKSQKEATSS